MSTPVTDTLQVTTLQVMGTFRPPSAPIWWSLALPVSTRAGRISGSALRWALCLFLVSLVGASLAAAANAPGKDSVLDVLIKWSPLLLKGFGFNLVISLLAMAAGTLAGLPLGIAQVSPNGWIARPAWFFTQFFRNTPWLVLLFFCMFLLPFQFRVFGTTIHFPDWAKAVMGFALPVMANTSEIVRGGIQSVPTSQWECSEALGFNRRQTLSMVILPQCVKRMLPPWMNLYSLITMSTVTASVVGVAEMLTLTSQVHAAEGSRPELLAPLYAFALLCFFLYCYPIGRLTARLERQFQVKL